MLKLNPFNWKNSPALEEKWKRIEVGEFLYCDIHFCPCDQKTQQPRWGCWWERFHLSQSYQVLWSLLKSFVKGILSLQAFVDSGGQQSFLANELTKQFGTPTFGKEPVQVTTWQHSHQYHSLDIPSVSNLFLKSLCRSVCTFLMTTSSLACVPNCTSCIPDLVRLREWVQALGPD